MTTGRQDGPQCPSGQPTARWISHPAPPSNQPGPRTTRAGASATPHPAWAALRALGDSRPFPAAHASDTAASPHAAHQWGRYVYSCLGDEALFVNYRPPGSPTCQLTDCAQACTGGKPSTTASKG